MFPRLPRISLRQRNSAQSVARYYDSWTERYISVGGEIIQAFRPSSDQSLIDYYIDSAELADGQYILDAGCGVCAPSILFARKLHVKIAALTISQQQAKLAQNRIKQEGLGSQISVNAGDYHRLANLYPQDTFDRVLFLESLGHAEDPQAVLEGAHSVLKSGGMLYIKDFFVRETKDQRLKKMIQKVVRNIDRLYSYNTLDLHPTLSSIRELGFVLRMLRRPTFVDDSAIRFAFEDKYGIDIFGGMKPFIPTDWLEICCVKP